MRAWRLWLLLALVLLCGSLAVNLFSVRLVRELYAGQLFSQVWPEGPRAPITAGPALPRGHTVLFLGDSRVAAWELPAIRNCQVINAGVPGATSAQLALRIRGLLEQFKPRIVVIQVGINDLKLLGVRPDLREAVVSACAGNITRMVDECHRQGSQVCVTLVWPASRPDTLRRLFWSPEVTRGWRELNQKLLQLPPDPDRLRVADLFGELTGNFPPEAAQTPPTLYRDTLHLKPETYSRLTPLLEKTLQPWLGIPGPSK